MTGSRPPIAARLPQMVNHLVLGLALTLAAAGPQSGKRGARPAASAKGASAKEATPAAASPPASPKPTATELQAMSVKDLLSRARALYDVLEYDSVLAFTEAVLARPDIALEPKLDAYALQGSALAIIADAIDAEKPFRLLLRAEPDFNLPESTPPKILAVFRKVQVEERAILEEFQKIERARLMASLRIEGDPPAEARGGRSLSFRYRLIDPRGAVESVRVSYRREGDMEFTSLPLKRDETGLHAGRILGEWTAGAGFTLQYYVSASDAKGVLASLGSAAKPMSLPVAAGQVEKNARPVPLWGFAVAAGTSVTAGLAASVLAGATMLIQADYERQIASASRDNPLNGAVLKQQEQLGTNVMVAQFVAWGVTGLGTVVTGVLAPFTNWSGELPEEDAAGEAATAAPEAPVALR